MDAVTLWLLIAWTVIVVIGELYGMPYSPRLRRRLMQLFQRKTSDQNASSSPDGSY